MYLVKQSKENNKKKGLKYKSYRSVKFNNEWYDEIYKFMKNGVVVSIETRCGLRLNIDQLQKRL